MEMQQVRYFLAVSRTLNFTRAAEECNVTQPALTRAVKQLEEELGGELIRREGRNSHLTDLGNRMQPLLQQCFDGAVAAKQVASKLKKGDVAALSLAVSRTFDLDLVTGPLAEVQRSFPALQLKIRRASGTEICELLKNGEVDRRLRPSELIVAGFDASLVNRIREMVRKNHYKRVMPLIAKVSLRTVGHDFLYPRDWEAD